MADSATRAAQVHAQLATIVHLVTGRQPAEVQPDHRLVEDLRIDSLAAVEIVEAAAQHFGVRIEDEAVKEFVRVRDLVDHVVEQLAGRS